ncbi:MAG: DNA translocase FtsK 4TM domain-containing protein [Elusimicrobia bacterium]|nr:DNA translocase FtsK 4TM domain-containing protein [Elusimicrobiota bacterium]
MRKLTKYNFASSQAKKKTSTLSYAIYWLLALAFSIWLIWIAFAGSRGGIVGGKVHEGLYNFFGFSSYLFPFLLLYGLAAILVNINKPHKGILTLATGIVLILGAISAELGLISMVSGNPAFDGGWLGYALEGLLSKIFGNFGVGLFSVVLLIAGVQLLFKISWRKALKKITAALADDYRNWTAARKEMKAKLSLVTEKEKKEGPSYDAKPISEAPAKSAASAPERAEPQIVRAKAEPPAGAAAAVKSRTESPARAAQAEGSKTASSPKDSYFQNFKCPPAGLLDAPSEQGFIGPTNGEINDSKLLLEATFKSFDVAAHVSGVYPGPVITRYEVTPASGVKISSIVSLSNDVALAMKSPGGIRVIAPIPGKSAIGFEIPNARRAKVLLREVLESSAFNERREPLAFGIGRHAEGSIATANLETMPHLLVAGATNSGKSVFLQSLILSLIYRNTPDEVKFLFIDPKRLELTFYEDIPYLYDPTETPDRVSVITNPKDAAKALVALTRVMEKRYIRFERARVKNIASYNKWALANGQPTEHYIVVVIDELADLILQMKNVVEDAIQRLAQMARAVGIHLVLATQRPSVDIITGVIKANLPSRVALQVTSRTDSQVILDTPGAESLIGRGDLLYLAIDAQKPARIQGAYVSEEEIKKVADFIRAQGRPHYQPLVEEEASAASGKGGSSEELLTALRLINERKRVSQDLLKAHFGSSSRATNILSILEVNGFIHKPEGSNRWEIFFDKIEKHLNDNAAPAQSPESPVGDKEEVK